jgi:hypothetical protein
MTVNVTRDAINVREKLAELDKPTGIAGEAMLRADTPQEQFQLIGAGRRNLIINGGMQIDQRNTTASGASGFSIDRFKHERGQLNSGLARATISSGTEPYKLGFRYSARVTTTNTSTATNLYDQIVYYPEGQDIAQSGWDYNGGGTLILSFWVKSSAAGTYGFFLEDMSATAQRIAGSYTVAANTWTRVEKIVPPSASLTIPNDNTRGLRILFIPAYGSEYISDSAIEHKWANADNTAYIRQSNGFALTSGSTFEITGVQLELGKVATPFEHRSYGEELALCQRYFERQTYTGGSYITIGLATNGSSAQSVLNYVEKRAAPSITLPSASSTNGIAFLTSTGGYPGTIGSNAANQINKHSCRINGSSYNGLTSASPSGLYVTLQQNIDIDAEL